MMVRPGAPGTVQSKPLQPGLDLAEVEETLTLRQCVHAGVSSKFNIVHCSKGPVSLWNKMKLFY